MFTVKTGYVVEKPILEKNSRSYQYRKHNILLPFVFGTISKPCISKVCAPGGRVSRGLALFKLVKITNAKKI